MNTFRIMSWTVTADKPENTEVTVAVFEDVNGVSRRTTFEMEIDGKFDTITPEFEEAVKLKLEAAGVL